jgi:hypothetical protein
MTLPLLWYQTMYANRHPIDDDSWTSREQIDMSNQRHIEFTKDQIRHIHFDKTNQISLILEKTDATHVSTYWEVVWNMKDFIASWRNNKTNFVAIRNRSVYYVEAV